LLEIGPRQRQLNLRVKFSALNVEFSSPISDPLRSRRLANADQIATKCMEIDQNNLPREARHASHEHKVFLFVLANVVGLKIEFKILILTKVNFIHCLKCLKSNGSITIHDLIESCLGFAQHFLVRFRYIFFAVTWSVKVLAKKQNCQRSKTKNLTTKRESISVKLSALSDRTGLYRYR